jgi:mono/diheme cytochrome c family protein
MRCQKDWWTTRNQAGWLAAMTLAVTLGQTLSMAELRGVETDLSERSASAGEQPVTFNKHIAPLVFEHCSGCHRPGEVAPFPLLTYRDVAKRAELLADVMDQRYMPPWKPVPGHGEFRGARQLTDDEIALLQRWIAGELQEGDPNDLPSPPQFVEGWQLGEPDIVVTMPEAYQVPAEGQDIYRNFVLPLEIPEGKYIRAIEFRPSNPRVVHHALLAHDRTGGARKLDAENPGFGFTRFTIPGQLFTGSMAVWTPGMDPSPLPEGFSMPWPAGADFVLQLHLHPSGKPELEQSRVGFFLTDQPPRQSMIDLIMIDRNIDIPPGESEYRTRDSFVLPIDVEVSGLFPHMHMLGRDIRITAALPDGNSVPLLWINDWDFNWQNYYQYRERLKLPKGTKVVMECVHDNSADNPRNPSRPPRRVKWGEETFDEMSVAFLQVVPANEEELAAMHKQLQGRIIGGFRKEGL